MASHEQRRVLLGIIALMAVIECLVWAIYAAIYLYLRTGDPFGPIYTAAQLALHGEIAWTATAMLILNIVATVAFILRSGGFGLSILAATQVANVAAIAVLRNVQGYEGWSGNVTLMAVPALTLVLLAVLWRVPPPLKQPRVRA